MDQLAKEVVVDTASINTIFGKSPFWSYAISTFTEAPDWGVLSKGVRELLETLRITKDQRQS